MLLTGQCVSKVYEQFTTDRSDDSKSVNVTFSIGEAVVRGIVELIVAVIVANMAAACSSGGWAILMWILGFLFWPFFFLYYVLTKSKCATYWTK